MCPFTPYSHHLLKHFLTSGPLYWLFPLPEALFPPYSELPPFLSPQLLTAPQRDLPALTDFREGKGGREKGRETSIGCLLRNPTGDQTHNLGMCPDTELNLQPFGPWDDAPTN